MNYFGRKVLSGSAVKRLQKDIIELSTTDGLDSVSAMPFNDDLSEWHVNLMATCGPYKGIILHLVLTFPFDYPSEPPEIELKTLIQHPNVFSNTYVCLDMLRTDTTGTPYEGWSTAYSVTSILLQLQTFLFSENIPQDYGGARRHNASSQTIRQSIKNARNFKCSCGHHENAGSIYPPFRSLDQGTPKPEPEPQPKPQPEPELEPQLEPQPSAPVTNTFQSSQDKKRRFSNDNQPKSLKQTEMSRDMGDIWTHLAASMLVPCFEFLNVSDLYRASRVNERWGRVVRDYCLVERRETRCFHSRVTYKEDVLGVGVMVTRHPNGNVKTITSEFDIISHTAFVHDHVRASVWGHEFQYFLPLAINNTHFKKALPILRSTISRITQEDFTPKHALNVICTLMNSFVVSLFTDEQQGGVSRHASEKALLGYCAFHHLLLSLRVEMPEIKEYVNRRVAEFQGSEENRIKKATPNLGTFIIYLTLTHPSLGWNEISISFLKEAFSRQVRWYLKDHPILETLSIRSYDEGHYRLETTLRATKTSRMLLMFQVYFLNNIGRRFGENPKSLLKAYNKSLGRPSVQQKEQLQIAAKEILRSNTWSSYFDRIQVKLPSEYRLAEILVNAVADSKRKGYHGLRCSKYSVYNHNRFYTQTFRVGGGSSYGMRHERYCGAY